MPTLYRYLVAVQYDPYESTFKYFETRANALTYYHEQAKSAEVWFCKIVNPQPPLEAK